MKERKNEAKHQKKGKKEEKPYKRERTKNQII